MTLWVGIKCVFSCETDTDGVVISPGGRGVDYKPENEVNVVNSTFDSWLSERLFFNQESKSFSFDGVATVDHVQVGNSGPTFAAANQHKSDTSDSKPSEPLLWAPAASCWVGVQRLQRSSAAVWSLQHSQSDRRLCRQTGNSTQPCFIPVVFKGSNLNLCFRSWQTCSIVCCLKWETGASPLCLSCR